MGVQIAGVHSINVTSLNVLEQQGETFTYEPEIEAEIALDIDVEVEGRYGPREYELSRRYTVSRTRVKYLYPEVIVRFEPSTGDLEFESVSLGSQTVSVSMDDID